MSVRVLILEDDPLIALDLQSIVEGEGHEVVDICPSVAVARARLHADPDLRALDFALLDVDLADGKSFEVARDLAARGVPFAFVSASLPDDLPESLRTARFVAKPYREDAIRGALPCA